MSKTRLDRWKTPRPILTGVHGGNEEERERVAKFQQEAPKKRNRYDDEEKFTISDMIGACKELIYDVRDGKPIFHAIMYGINAEYIDIEPAPIFEILVSPDDSDEKVNEEIQNILAIATMEEVPVYPNTESLATELANYHRDMLIHGFTAPDGKGGRVRLKLTRSPGSELISPEYLEKLDSTITYFPAEIELIRQTLRDELRRRDHAGRILANLTVAISELEGFLGSQTRNEAELQKCLTDNPILFGTDFVRIIPKHKLGSEFEMDYALERTSGHVDLVEIEASNLKLYTRSGNPTSHLVHAEQQVLDWLVWLERNSAYAREHLPGMMSPIGFVVIGRRGDLDSKLATKLQKRNAIFRGRLHVLTYDDLLDQAKNLLSPLEGLKEEGSVVRKRRKRKETRNRN